MSVRNYADVGENAQLIMKRLIANDTLCRLLYYRDKDPLETSGGAHPITDAIRKELFDNYIKIIPKVGEEEIDKSVIALKFSSFLPNTKNDEFKDILFNVEVFTPFSQWKVKDVNLRPFLIMGEIEKSLKDKSINGLGKIKSTGAELVYLTEEISCYELSFTLTSYD